MIGAGPRTTGTAAPPARRRRSTRRASAEPMTSAAGISVGGAQDPPADGRPEVTAEGGTSRSARSCHAGSTASASCSRAPRERSGSASGATRGCARTGRRTGSGSGAGPTSSARPVARGIVIGRGVVGGRSRRASTRRAGVGASRGRGRVTMRIASPASIVRAAGSATLSAAPDEATPVASASGATAGGAAGSGAAGSAASGSAGDAATDSEEATGAAGCGPGSGSIGPGAADGAEETGDGSVDGSGVSSVERRAGRKRSGSRYPLGSSVRRTPRCTYGVARAPLPGDPTVPTCAPSATVRPRARAIEPRWTSVTEYPSSVTIVTARPYLGTEPANEIVPARDATTGSPGAPPTAIPRCWPPAYGSSPSWKRWRTGPDAGQVHAPAGGASARADRSATPAVRRWDNMATRVESSSSRCQIWLQFRHRARGPRYKERR